MLLLIMETKKETQMTFEAALEAYRAHLGADYATFTQSWVKKHPESAERIAAQNEEWVAGIAFEKGSKFIKVAIPSGSSRSAHSFIVIKEHGKFKVGDILKAASWATPAKNFARGNVLEGDFARTRWAGC